MEDKITYEDVKEYERLFTLAPSILLQRFARKKTNLVLKFQQIVQGYLDGLSDDQKHQLDLILGSEIEELQSIMREAYLKTRKRQFEILADEKNRQFIKDNLDSIRDMIH